MVSTASNTSTEQEEVSLKTLSLLDALDEVLAGLDSEEVLERSLATRKLAQLVEDNSSIDPTYIEDFLLTHRTFVDKSVVVADQLLEWFSDPVLR